MKLIGFSGLALAAAILLPAELIAAEDSEPDEGAETEGEGADISLSGDAGSTTRSERKVYGLVLFEVGAGKMDEDHFGRQGLSEFRVGAGMGFQHGFSLWGTYRGRFYDKGYISALANAPEGEGSRLVMKEGFHDAILAVTWNALSSVTDAVELGLTFGPRFNSFDNKSFAVWTGSLVLGVGVLVRPSERFHLLADGAWSAAFMQEEETLSVMGMPKHFWDVGGGFGFDFHAAVKWSLELRWHGSWVVLEKSKRDYQSALVGLSVEI